MIYVVWERYKIIAFYASINLVLTGGGGRVECLSLLKLTQLSLEKMWTFEGTANQVDIYAIKSGGH